MVKDKTASSPRLIPSTRFTLALLVSFAFFVQYAQRVSLSMGIICMIDRTNINTTLKSTSYPGQIDNRTSSIFTKYGSQILKDKQFKWSEFQQQALLGAYWFGYIFTLVPSGWLAITLGAKKVFAGSLLLSSIATLGISSVYFIDSFNFYIALVFRIVIGFTHGPLFPATYAIWSAWAVPEERSTLTAIGFCSTNLGTSMTMLIGGIFCRYLSSGWVYIFLLTSAFGFLWFPLWMWLVADSPQTHRTISEKEQMYISNNTNKKKKNVSVSSLPWKKLFRSKPIIGLFVTECCNLFGLFFFYMNLGKILTEIHRVPTQFTGYVLAGGFILMPISSLSTGVIADYLFRTEKMSLTNVRKLFNSLSSLIPGVCTIVLCFCDHTRQIYGIITILILLATSAMAYGSGYIVNFADILPPGYSSIVFGITTAAATCGALLANVIAGLVIKQPILEDWRKIFILFSVIYFIGGVVYIILGSATPRTCPTLQALEEQSNDDKIPEEEVPMQVIPSVEEIKPAEIQLEKNE